MWSVSAIPGADPMQSEIRRRWAVARATSSSLLSTFSSIKLRWLMQRPRCLNVGPPARCNPSIGSTRLVNDAISEQPLSYRCGDMEMTGILARDEAKSSSRPAVVVVHDAWGVGDLVKLRARMLAELGFIALAIDLYGAGNKPKTMDEAKAQLD